MESKSVDSILAKIAGSVGFIICLLGAAMLDMNFNEGFIALIIGGLLLLLYAYEDGQFRANKK